LIREYNQAKNQERFSRTFTTERPHKNTMKPFEQVWRQAQGLYSTIGYHTWGHAVEVMERAVHFAERARRYGIPVRLDVLKKACLLHDLLYWLNPEDFIVRDQGQYRSAQDREEVAIVTTRSILSRAGFSQEEITAVEIAIDGSRVTSPLLSVEAKLLAAADLGGVAGPYGEFFAANEALRQETAFLSGKPILPRATWARRSMPIMARYLARRIEVTPEYLNAARQSQFHLAADGNLEAYLKQNSGFGHELPIIGELDSSPAPFFTTCDIEMPFAGIYIGINGDETARLACLDTIQTAHSKRHGSPSYAFVIPGEKQGISLPDNLLQLLVVRNSLRGLSRFRLPLLETRRVLRPDGQLCVIETSGQDFTPLHQDTYQRGVRIKFEAHGFEYTGINLNQHGFEMWFNQSS
jgi:HD superfamily phosphodiesterase